MILRKMIFFFPCLVAFQKMLQKIFYSVVQKIEQKRWGEVCVFRKWFTKKLGVNHFPNFNKEFSG